MKTLKTLILAGAFALTSCNPNPPIPTVPAIPYLPSIPPYEEPEKPVIPEEPDDPIVEEPPIEEPEEPIEEPPIVEPPRDDFYVSIEFNNPKVGEKFKYTGRVQNKHLDYISMDSETGGLEWSLMKGGERIDNTPLPNSLSITLKEQGYIEVEQFDNEMELTTENTIITYEGKTYEMPFKVKYKLDNETHTFTEEGMYTLEFLINYILNGEAYESRYASEFNVTM